MVPTSLLTVPSTVLEVIINSFSYALSHTNLERERETIIKMATLRDVPESPLVVGEPSYNSPHDDNAEEHELSLTVVAVIPEPEDAAAAEKSSEETAAEKRLRMAQNYLQALSKQEGHAKIDDAKAGLSTRLQEEAVSIDFIRSDHRLLISLSARSTGSFSS